MATVIGGALAYATPIGMPANSMIYGIGNYRFMDYVKVGLPLIVLAMVVALVLLPIIFPFFPKHYLIEGSTLVKKIKFKPCKTR